MTWDEIGRDSLMSGRELLAAGRFRSSVSRSYYAGFSVVVGRILPHVKLPPRMMTPRHDELPSAVKKHLRKLYPKDQRMIARLLLQLYRARIASDYDASRNIEEGDALDAARMVSLVFRLLSVPNV